MSIVANCSDTVDPLWSELGSEAQCKLTPRSTSDTCKPHSAPRPHSTQKERNTDSRNALIYSSRPPFSSNGSTDPCADLSLSDTQQRVGLPTCGLPHQVVLVPGPSYGPPEQESPTTATLGGGSEITTMLRTRGLCGSR